MPVQVLVPVQVQAQVQVRALVQVLAMWSMPRTLTKRRVTLCETMGWSTPSTHLHCTLSCALPWLLECAPLDGFDFATVGGAVQRWWWAHGWVLHAGTQKWLPGTSR